MSARVLLTGFVPFANHTVNPSERVVRRLSEAPLDGIVLSTRILPVSYREAFEPVREALEDQSFHALLLCGLGTGRATIDFERLAVNWRGSSTPDNLGDRIDGEQIDPVGPAAYFSTVPSEEMVTACRAVGAPAAASSHAGTFVCNQVLYQSLRHCDRRNLSARVGFVHLPLLLEQAAGGEPAQDENTMTQGLRAALLRLVELPPPQRADDLVPAD